MTAMPPTPRLPRADLDHVLQHTRPLWDELRGQSVFITGGTAFVGIWLLESLLWADAQLGLGVDVTVLTRDVQAFRQRVPHLAASRSVQLLQGDAASFEFPSGCYPYVVHAAMEPAYAPTAERPLSAFTSNVNGTQHVLEFARTHGVRRLLLTSSGAVYGRQPHDLTHIPEDYPGAPATEDPASVYGQAKRVSEFMCSMYGRVHGFDAITARLFAFVGPWLPLDSNFAVGNFVRDAMAGTPVRIGGDGTPWRSYLYAADMACWLWTLLLRGRPGTAYNVGSPQALTIAELAHAVVHATAPGTPVEIAARPVPGAPAARYVPATARAQQELGLGVHITLDEGIRRTVQWHRSAAQAA